MGNHINVKAIDDGYGDTKFTDGKKEQLISSFVTPFKPKPLNVFGQANGSSEYISAIIDGVRYTVGDYAAKLDPRITWIGGENKHNDTRFPVILKTSLGLMSKNPTEVIDTLVMGLPVKSDTPARQEQLRKLAKGSHEIELSLDGKNYVKRSILIENVVVKSQPFGSFCDVLLNDQGEVKRNDLINGFVLVVDIGARTLNILTIDKLEQQPELTTHTNDGMFTAYQSVANYLESEMNITIPDGKLQQLIQQKEIKRFDISNLIKQSYMMLANNIISILDKTFIDSWDYVTDIIFTGGGSTLLKPYLVERYEKAIFLDRYATARGLQKYGIRMSKDGR